MTAAATLERGSSDEPSHRDLANAIRALAMDAVEAAKSGHPGMPMGMADVATVLFTQFLRFDPGAPGLARPRPLRAVGRARLDAALRAALPDRLSRHGPRAAAALPPARLAHRGPSRVRPCARHRDHHRAARPGPRQRGRHGAGRAPSARPVRRGSGRPPHLRDRERRRPDGGHQPRGVLARRPSAPRPADRAVRRQPHLDRRLDRARPVRQHAQAVRGLRLAGRARSTATIPRRSSGRSGRGPGRGPAEPDRLPHHDRLRRADQGRHRRDPRLAARRRRGGGGAPRSSAGRIRRSRSRRDLLAAWRGFGGRGAPVRAAWAGASGAPAGGRPGRVRAGPGGRPAARAGRCPARAQAASCRGAADLGDPQGQPGGARGVHRRRCRSWSAARPT